MKKLFKVSAVLSLLLFGGSLLVASSIGNNKVHAQQNQFKPVLEAEDLVQVAAKLDKSKQKKALMFLDKAKSELKKAKVSSETKELRTKIIAIEKAIKNNKKTDKLYSDVIFRFDAYINRIKQWGYEIRAHDEEAIDIKNYKFKEKSNVF